MHIINIHHLSVNYTGRPIFTGITWQIGNRDKIGLVGPNGAGKSSMLKVLAGEISPDSGEIIFTGDIRIGYLKQDVTLEPGITLYEAAMNPPPDIANVEARLNAIENQLGLPEVYNDTETLEAVLAEQDAALREYEKVGAARHANHVRELLAALGFTREQFDLPTETLSGGQKKMIALLRLAVANPDVLLLDEPDNHLDLEAKQHLEGFIRTYSGAIIIVSHDRYLLDETISQIVEMENGKLHIYPGNYSQYAHQKERDRIQQEQMYAVQQKQLNKIEEQIKRFEMLAKVFEDERSARQARSRRKMLERMEENGEIIDKAYAQRVMNLAIAGGRGSTKALEFKGVSMAFDDDPIFLDLDLLVRHGERVGLIGPNGAGKSVLFRLILGKLQPLEGEIKIGPSSQIGYYAQEHETLAQWLKRTPIDLVRDVRPMAEGAAVTQLLKFAFTYDQTRQPIGTLSGGERSRLQLLRLMLGNPNLLLLDEPTNNLDIASTEVLEEALNDFEGAIFTISHDRYFLDRIVDRVVELNDGILNRYIGGYTDFLESTGKLQLS